MKIRIKKGHLMLLLIFSARLGFGQAQNFNIQGRIGNYDLPAKIYLKYQENRKSIIDSATLRHGEFHISGKIDKTVSGYLLLDETGSGIANAHTGIVIYIEPGNIVVNSAGQLAGAIAQGTRTNDQNLLYSQILKALKDEVTALRARQNTVPLSQQYSPAFTKEYSIADSLLSVKKKTALTTFIKENANSPISIKALQNLVQEAEVYDFDNISQLYAGLDPTLRDSEEGKTFISQLPALKKIAIGAIAPEFSQADTKERTVSLSSFRSHYVLLDFWASWCVPCRAENPKLVEAYSRFKDRNFTILGISLDRAGDRSKWLKAVQNDQLTWTNLSDLKFFNNEVARLYEVRSIPQNFLIDPSGRIIAKNLKGDDLTYKLRSILANAGMND